MTQKEVADLLGISQSYISRLEKRIISRMKKTDASLGLKLRENARNRFVGGFGFFVQRVRDGICFFVERRGF